jgi:hypothetical protein
VNTCSFSFVVEQDVTNNDDPKADDQPATLDTVAGEECLHARHGVEHQYCQ